MHGGAQPLDHTIDALGDGLLSLLLLLLILLSHRSLRCIDLALMAISLLIHQRTSTLTAPL
jgi:hypothetical protein